MKLKFKWKKWKEKWGSSILNLLALNYVIITWTNESWQIETV